MCVTVHCALLDIITVLNIFSINAFVLNLKSDDPFGIEKLIKV